MYLGQTTKSFKMVIGEVHSMAHRTREAGPHCLEVTEWWENLIFQNILFSYPIHQTQCNNKLQNTVCKTCYIHGVEDLLLVGATYNYKCNVYIQQDDPESERSKTCCKIS